MWNDQTWCLGFKNGAMSCTSSCTHVHSLHKCEQKRHTPATHVKVLMTDSIFFRLKRSNMLAYNNFLSGSRAWREQGTKSNWKTEEMTNTTECCTMNFKHNHNNNLCAFVCFYSHFLGECLQWQELFSEHVAQISRDNVVSNTSRWDHTHTTWMCLSYACIHLHQSTMKQIRRIASTCYSWHTQ